MQKDRPNTLGVKLGVKRGARGRHGAPSKYDLQYPSPLDAQTFLTASPWLHLAVPTGQNHTPWFVTITVVGFHPVAKSTGQDHMLLHSCVRRVAAHGSDQRLDPPAAAR